MCGARGGHLGKTQSKPLRPSLGMAAGELQDDLGELLLPSLDLSFPTSKREGIWTNCILFRSGHELVVVVVFRHSVMSSSL